MNHNPPLIPRVSPYAVWYNLLKHNNLMLRSERRERLEAWAASDSSISHSQYWRIRSPSSR